MIHEAVKARPGLQLVPAQLRRALGQASLPSLLEALHPHPGGIEYGFVVRLSGDRFLADPVPVQELSFHVAVGIELAGVD